MEFSTVEQIVPGTVDFQKQTVPALKQTVPALNFFTAVGVKYKQNMLTDNIYSENNQYSDFVLETLGDDWQKKNPLHKGLFGLKHSKYKQVSDMWDKGMYEIVDGEVKTTQRFDDLGLFSTEKVPPNNPIVKAVHDMKTRGWTLDKIDNEVITRTQKKFIQDQKELAYYDDHNWYGASGLAEFIGDFGSWLSDPINATALGGEIGVFKALGKGLLKEGAYMSKMMKDGKLSPGAKKMITDAILSGKKDELYRKAIKGYLGKERVKEAAKIGGVSGLIGYLTEFIHQEGTFDFKTRVMDGKTLRKYSDKDKEVDIRLSGAIGLASAGILNLGGNLIARKLSKRPVETAIGVESSDEAILRVVDDIENDIPVNSVDRPDDIQTDVTDVTDVTEPKEDFDYVYQDEEFVKENYDLFHEQQQIQTAKDLLEECLTSQ